MATGASNAELAVILIDARKGVLVQTRRHVAHLLAAWHPSCRACGEQDRSGGFPEGSLRPHCERLHVVRGAARFHLNHADPALGAFRRQRHRAVGIRPGIADRRCCASGSGGCRAARCCDKPFRFPVQWVNRPNLDFRGYAGTVISGTIKVGRRRGRRDIRASLTDQGASSPMTARVVGARRAMRSRLRLPDEVDIARGDVLVKPASRPEVSDQFAAHLIWMSEEPLMPGRSYLARIGTKTTADHDHRHQIQDRRQHPRASGGAYAGSERHRLSAISHRRSGRFRSLRREPPDRLLHHHRPLHEPHRRRRHDRFRPAARHQCRIGSRCWSARPSAPR